jgi:prephenate dehydratase/chorismate mutase/prephenate dehydratase
MNDENESTLKSLRRQIDLLDARLVRLLDERMEVALRAKRFKSEVVAPDREEAVLDAASRNAQVVSPEFTRQIFREIVQESVRLQSVGGQLIGFQGEHGAYGELAVRQYAEEAIPISCVEFADVFDGVRSGMFDLGVVPVENSIAGAVAVVSDLLVECDLSIVGEVRLAVHHSLTSLPETDYRDIRVVYSHPMALAQCHGFISRNRLEARPWYDTAGAAKMLAHDRPEASAAIASAYSARLYGLEIVKENIEDHPSNYTRFLVLAREPLASGGDKCSICFSTAHRAGALFEVLKIFSEARINLTRIESLPTRSNPGNFSFLLDLQGSDQDPRVADPLRRVREHATGYKFLGCYREAR